MKPRKRPTTPPSERLDLYHCHICGNDQAADLTRVAEYGRPICCGRPMDPDSPDERKRLAAIQGAVPAAKPNQHADRWNDLTTMDRNVAQLLALGLSHKEIGTHLHVSESTVGFHQIKIYEKMRVHRVIHLIAAMEAAGPHVLDHADWLRTMLRQL